MAMIYAIFMCVSMSVYVKRWLQKIWEAVRESKPAIRQCTPRSDGPKTAEKKETYSQSIDRLNLSLDRF